jgi:DMSO/TMAO reductase YedYZ molybdopterin-dependent catalytic subunit
MKGNIMTKNNIKLVNLFRYLFLAGITALGFFTIIATGGGGSDNATQDLGAGEIREYEGQQLSSINDFRENSILGPQYINLEDYQLKITGLVETPIAYTYDNVINNFDHYKKVVTLHCVEGWSVKLLWEGMLVRDVIEEAGPLSTVKVIIFHSYDGYSTSFPIEYVMDNDIIMAYKMNDITIPQQRGFPFQLVAEDKWGYKWAKWITEIELSDDENYMGFWESRGYSNSGSLYECTPGLISAQPAEHTTRTDCCACHSVSAN